MDSFSTLHLSPSDDDIERAQLRCSFQLPTLRRAAALAVELRPMGVGAPRLQAVPPWDRHDWIVTLTTPEIPLTVGLLSAWEEQMVAIEQAWPGCRFLGWRTLRRPHPSGAEAARGRSRGEQPSHSEPHEPPRAASSQRQLVIASLLRSPEVLSRQG